MFQEYLRTIYPDLDSLNAQWQTDFANWESIRFSSEADMLGDVKNPSAWTDYRMFISRKFAEANQRMRKAIEEEHPGAVVGWDGAEQYSSYDGYDWWQLTRHMDLVQVYHTYILPGVHSPKIFNGQAVKSFRPNAKLSGAWLNSADRRYGGEYATWYLFLNGWNSVWWWHSTFLHPANGACNWDLTLTPIVESATRATKEIKAGPAALLAHAEKQTDPIAVHYSENNWHASTLESGVANHVNNLGLKEEFWMTPQLVGRMIQADDEMRQLWGGIKPAGHYAAASKNFYLLLHDLGFQPRTMARQEIEAGSLVDSGMKVLVLPFVVSLSDAEVKRIRAFVEGGGLLIADYCCGLRDLHCRLREKPPLDEVFGISRQGNEVRRSRGQLVAEYRGKHGAKFESVFRESLAPDGATVYAYHDDGMPALFVNHIGQGAAIYLNADLYAYDAMRRHGTEQDLRELFRALLIRLADLHAPFVPEHRFGHPVAHTEVTRFTDGETQYWGVLPDFAVDDKTPVAVTMPFPAGMHVYDVRQRRQLGDTGVAEGTLEPGQVQLYAALPYQVTGISASGPGSIPRGARAQIELRVASSGGELAGHAARVTVTLPDGSKPEYLTKTLYLPEGKGEFSFVPALNAQPGVWTVNVVEVMSGERAQLVLRVE